MLTLGSLFDGIGGFPLVAKWNGIKTLWASEIEKAPMSITKKHFPEMQHLGDITKINGAEIPPVSIICGGSPCQDLSVAGKRKGLQHKDKGDEETTRSGLFIEMIRIIKEMRDATGRNDTISPRFVVWENVVGAISSNGGDDFRCVLEEFCKIHNPNVTIPRPKGNWPNAGLIVDGDSFSLGWRIVDAQYELAQRRKRVYLVADFGGCSARQILFKSPCVFRNNEAGLRPWQRFTENSEGCPRVPNHSLRGDSREGESGMG